MAKLGKGGERRGRGDRSLGARLAGFGSTAFGCQRPGKNAESSGSEKDARAPSALVTICFSWERSRFQTVCRAWAHSLARDQGRPRTVAGLDAHSGKALRGTEGGAGRRAPSPRAPGCS